MLNSLKNTLKGMFPIDNNYINLHLGVHKTATTFLQENIALQKPVSLSYVELDEFREIRNSVGFRKSLKSFDWSKNVLISDENLIGDNSTIKSGKLYPQLAERLDAYISNFKNKTKVSVYISIRPMVDFLPSQYCEYLRWHPFIHYDEFVSNVDLLKLSWYSLLKSSIEKHNVEFVVFDFVKFKINGKRLLNELTFGELKEFSEKVPVSRQSFTNADLYSMSGERNHEYANDSNKFSPYSPKEKMNSFEKYYSDIELFSNHANVRMI